jgi:hypothetical protein
MLLVPDSAGITGLILSRNRNMHLVDYSMTDRPPREPLRENGVVTKLKVCFAAHV